MLEDKEIYHARDRTHRNIRQGILCFFLLVDGAIVAGSMEGEKIERGIYYHVLKFTPKELAFHRSRALTFPTAKNVIEGLRQRNPVVFNQAFKIFDISSDVATGWHPED